jgi:large subunit ribosomal protein L22
MENTKLTRKEKIAAGLEKKPKRNKVQAEARKEARKEEVTASLHREGYSPRKMRLLADLIRGKKVTYALGVLKLSTRAGAEPLRKLVLSAINNYEQKNEGRVDVESLFVHTIAVDAAQFLKRFRPAPQGRAYRVRKRTNHVFIKLDTMPETTDKK